MRIETEEVEPRLEKKADCCCCCRGIAEGEMLMPVEEIPAIVVTK